MVALHSFGRPGGDPRLTQPGPLQRLGDNTDRLLDGVEIAAARDHHVEQGDGPFGAGEIVGHAEWLGSAGVWSWLTMPPSLVGEFRGDQSAQEQRRWIGVNQPFAVDFLLKALDLSGVVQG